MREGNRYVGTEVPVQINLSDRFELKTSLRAHSAPHLTLHWNVRYILYTRNLLRRKFVLAEMAYTWLEYDQIIYIIDIWHRFLRKITVYVLVLISVVF